MKYYSKCSLLISLIILIIFSACDMPLKKDFDFDKSAHLKKPSPYDASIWDYMTHPNNDKFDHNDYLDSMVIAVNRTGMEKVYKEGEDKTVFLLRNEAFKDFLSDHGYKSINEVPIYMLKNLLRYHVIPDHKIEQIDLRIAEYYQYQTLVKGSDGLINLFIDHEYWQIHINTGGPNLSSTAKSAIVFLHNFEFTNGVAHQLNTYARWVSSASINNKNK